MTFSTQGKLRGLDAALRQGGRVGGPGAVPVDPPQPQGTPNPTAQLTSTTGDASSPRSDLMVPVPTLIRL